MFECWRSSLAPVSAHGGAATLQFGSEGIDAGDTIEVVGDIATDGPVVLTLIADADGVISTEHPSSTSRSSPGWTQPREPHPHRLTPTVKAVDKANNATANFVTFTLEATVGSQGPWWRGTTATADHQGDDP
jgi:hypothetical protein